MAIYKYEEYVSKSSADAFDSSLEPGTHATWPGIYKCEVCGHEIATAANHVLPSQNHHQHAAGAGPIRWRLVVSHKKW
jgi:hypothetical protein